MTLQHGIDFSIAGQQQVPPPTTETIVGIVGVRGTAVSGFTRAAIHTPTLVTTLAGAQQAFGTGHDMINNIALLFDAASVRIVGVTIVPSGAEPSFDEWIAGVRVLRRAASVVGLNPTLIYCPGTFSYTGSNLDAAANTVVAAVNGEADLINGLAVVDGPPDYADMRDWAAANDAQQRRALFCFPEVVRSVVSGPQSGAVAVMAAMVRADLDLGIQRQPSNIAVPVISSLAPAPTFSYRDITTEAQALDNDLRVTSIVNHGGFRLWGGQLRPSTTEPSEFRYASIRRVADFIEESLITAAQPFVDAGLTPETERDILKVGNEFMRSISTGRSAKIRDGSVTSLGRNTATATLTLAPSILPILPTRRISWELTVARE